jgi:hypothetical protein
VNADAAVVTVTLEVGSASQPGTKTPLAMTGADLDVLVAVGLALVVVGFLMVLLVRHRLETTHA